jgi:prolyl-tRNA editing enzyme YbaK/EbsC (Cys-tRNA(Pro) deacylase)
MTTPDETVVTAAAEAVVNAGDESGPASRTHRRGNGPVTVDLSHPQIRNVTDRLRALGARGQVRVLADSARTAAAAAAGLGCEVGAIANSLLFDADGSPVLILTSGAHRVDTELVARTLGIGRLGRADPDFVRTHTGQPIGGVSPVGHPARVPTYLDRALAVYDVIWASAGHPHAVFSTSYEELQALTDATPIAVS